MIQRRKRNSSKINLTISFVVHGILIFVIFFFAAREGMLGKKLKEITVTMVPKEKKPEPPKEKPRVKVTAIEPPSISGDSIGYVFRIDSETAGIQPITAKLRLVKEGGAWAVSEFSQTP